MRQLGELSREDLIAHYVGEGRSLSYARVLADSTRWDISPAQYAQRADSFRKKQSPNRALSILLQMELFRQELSQTELREKSGVGKSALSYIIKGRSLPGDENLEQILNALGLPILDVEALGSLYKSNILGQSIHHMYKVDPNLEDFNCDPQKAFSYFLTFENIKQGSTVKQNHVKEALGISSDSYRQIKQGIYHPSVEEANLMIQKLGYEHLDYDELVSLYQEGLLEDFMLSY